MRKEQIDQLLREAGYNAAVQEPLPGDASFRRYIRIKDAAKPAMLMDAPPDKEDVRPYMQVATHLSTLGYSAPHIVASKPEAGLLLLEDLGDDTFTRILKQGSESEETLYAAAVDLLVDWYLRQANVSDARKLHLPRYDQALLMREVQLFSNWYLPQLAGLEPSKVLATEYVRLWEQLLQQAPLQDRYFVHRDYHVDNLMWLPARQGHARVGLLDFQDAVYGDAAYDLVSLLEDARRDVPQPLVDQMLARFIDATGMDADSLMLAYALLGAQRNCKIIGIFTRLAARDGKAHYLAHVPRVWKNLERDLAHPFLQPLKIWMDRHIAASARGVIPIQYDARALALTA
ncbi:MAG: phosphotransferase [Rickettsiales bacterium]|nr:phosphotransferase [Rickettsiales bacterium]